MQAIFVLPVSILIASLIHQMISAIIQADHVPNFTMFVCVEFFRPSQPNGVMLSAVRLPSHTFTGQA